MLDSRTGICTRRETLGLLASTAAAIAIPARAGVHSPSIDQLASKLIRDRVTPGVSIAVIRDGKPIYARGFGLANLETRTPVTPQTVFRVGSITKHFTAAAVLLLAEDGKLSLDDKVARFYPELPRARDITLRQLLTHTSGLNAYDGPQVSEEAEIQMIRKEYDDKGLLELISATTPYMKHEPGTGFFYTNANYTLAGLIIGKAAGEPYGEFMTRRLIQPLGLARTSWFNPRVILLDRATGYEVDPKAPTGFANALYHPGASLSGAAGALLSTPEEMCQWHEALLNGKVLKASSLVQMLMPVRLNDGSVPMRSAGPGGQPPAGPREYGFGLNVGEFAGRRSVYHGGATPGFIAQLHSFPAERLIIATAFNIESSTSPAVRPASEGLTANIVSTILS